MKPMLASPVKDLGQLKYPVYASPKLDGIRALVINGVVVSRSLKRIPNEYVQTVFGRKEYNGLDGELIVGVPTAKDVFSKTTSAVMSKAGVPDVYFWVFDILPSPQDWSYEGRLRLLRTDIENGPSTRIVVVRQKPCKNASEVEQFELDMLSLGYEGVMLRSPKSPYKYGRSTLKEGYLLKLKRFEDSEAMVLGMTELMHNGNEAETNALGQKERSSKKANMVGKGTMGSLLVKDVKTGVEFEIGTGFTAEQRDWWWNAGKAVTNCGFSWVVKYKYQPIGVKDKPRFPVFIGIRDRRDM